MEAKDGTSGSCLAAAGLTHETQSFTLADGKGNIVHSLNIAPVFAESAGREILL